MIHPDRTSIAAPVCRLAVSSVVAIATLALAACATPPAPPAQPDSAQVLLEKMLNKPRSPDYMLSADAPAAGPRLVDGKMWVSFRGDAVDLLKKLEPVTGKKVAVTGPQPRLPLYVQVSAAGLPADEVFKDIGYQLGQRADLILQAQTIEIRFRSY